MLRTKILARPSEPESSRRRLLLLGILALGLLLRLAYWWAVRDQPFVAWLAMDSQEYDRWGREVLAGDWLGSQVFFQAPLYPYLLAVLYSVSGGSLNAVYLFQIVLAVAGLYGLYRAGLAMADEKVGLAAAGLGAVYGPFLFYDVQLLKESLAITVVCFLLWALAAARDHERRSPGWLGVGVLLGILALLRENALLLVPFLLPLAWSREGGWKRLARSAVFLLLGMAVALAPVALRNGLVGGSYLPTTFNAGISFYIGNNAQADGTYQPIVPGKQIPLLEREGTVRLAEQALDRKLEPSEISDYWLGLSLDWAAAHPGAFLRLQMRKLEMFWSWYEWPDAVDYYWFRRLSPVLRLPLLEFGGAVILAAVALLLVRRRLGPFAPALLFALGWMASTVIFFLFSRYRLPVVPPLLVLAGVTVRETVTAWSAWRTDPSRQGRRRALGLAGLCLAAVLLPRAIGFEPRMDLVHSNLARLYEARGRFEEAREHDKAAFILNPKDFVSCLNLGNHAARKGDWPTALRFFQRAAALESKSDDVESNLGAVYLAIGDLPQAERHFDRALALNPRNVGVLHNKALARLRMGDLAGARDLVARLLAAEPGNAAGLRLRERIGA